MAPSTHLKELKNDYKRISGCIRSGQQLLTDSQACYFAGLDMVKCYGLAYVPANPSSLIQQVLPPRSQHPHILEKVMAAYEEAKALETPENVMKVYIQSALELPTFDCEFFQVEVSIAHSTYISW